jgi:hypothetical protein
MKVLEDKIKIKLDATLTQLIEINKSATGPIPFTNLNIYTNQIITEWKEEEIKGIKSVAK